MVSRPFFSSCSIFLAKVAVYEMAKSFADKEMSPYAREWDEKETFPREILRTLASLGFGGWHLSHAHMHTEIYLVKYV